MFGETVPSLFRSGVFSEYSLSLFTSQNDVLLVECFKTKMFSLFSSMTEFR